MSRVVSPEVQAALAERVLVARDFITLTARDRTTGAPVTDGFWSDVGTVSAEVINPDTGLPEARTFNGAGSLVSVEAIPAVANLTIQSVGVTMSQIHDRVEQLVRLYDLKQGRIEIHRGLFDPDTRRLVAPAECRFVGFVDNLTIETPVSGGSGSVNLSCVSHSREINRANTDTRSDDSQRRRHPSDNFYQDTATVGGWELFWGTTSGKAG